MPNKNQVIIVGHMARDPELKFIGQNSTPACSFTVAVNSGKGDKQETTWFRCQAWKDLAEEIAERFHKGDAIHCEGQMRCRQWEDKEGNKRESWELTVWECSVPVYRKRSGGHQGQAPVDDDQQVPF